MLSEQVKATGYKGIKAFQRLRAGSGYGNYLSHVCSVLLFFLLLLFREGEVKTQKLSVVSQIS